MLILTELFNGDRRFNLGEKGRQTQRRSTFKMVPDFFSFEAYVLQISDMPNLCITFLSKKSFGVFMATFLLQQEGKLLCASCFEC